MSKRQKLSFHPLEDLPDEILLKIFSLLDIKGVFQCGHVSMRLRAISNDQSLWSKLNFSGQKVPYGFIEKAVQNGCEYLNLRSSSVHGSKKSNVPWKLKYLALGPRTYVPEGVLQNCHFLEKLAVDVSKLMPSDIEQVCQNGETLRILSLGNFYFSRNQTKLIQKLFTECHQLTEVKMTGLSSTLLHGSDVCALVDNLTPNILKLDLGYQKSVNDNHVNTLVRRCNRITELNLCGTSITNESVKSIVEHLNFLEKLGVYRTNIDCSTLLKLKSIPTLKVLHCFGRGETDTERIKNLKLQLPHISINPSDDFPHIATSRKKRGWKGDWFWEIKANQQDYFPKAQH